MFHTNLIVIFALALTTINATATATSTNAVAASDVRNIKLHTKPTIKPSLESTAEASDFKKTGRYDEVIRLCKAYQRSYPKQVRCTRFGQTPEGRPMMALIATRTGAFMPEQAKRRGIPVLLVQGGIHAGEIDGKDAGFLALRDVLDGRAASTGMVSVLDKQVVIFVPVFNIDGHERFGKWNRPNQVGPDEMGWRTTAQNFNLNRDYAKADAPEMQAMLALVNAWDPLAYIDLHVTDGAKFEHDIAIQVEPVYAGDVRLRKIGLAFRGAVINDLAETGSLPLPFYPSFNVNDDPASGFTDGVAPPRFSTGYFLTRNRFGMLVETHSWKDYATRVRATRNTVVSVISQIAEHGAEWRKAALVADLQAAGIAGQSVELSYKASEKKRVIDFRGYEYTRTMSDVSGALMTRYDDTKPQIWKLTVRDDVVPNLRIVAPRGGYIVPAAHAAWVGEKLRQHGIVFRKLSKSFINAELEVFRAEKVTFSGGSNESHQELKIEGKWQTVAKNESLAAEAQLGSSIQPGSLFVPIAQARSLLVMALLEPQAPDSFLAWGYFNNAFERKEYMEDYVAEAVAREQMAADPTLVAAFKNRLANDAEFAKSPAARLDFFAKRHQSWDQRFNVYPVMRVGVLAE